MPSPIGHSLAAIASGWGFGRPGAAGRELLLQSAVLSVIGVAPDLDLLWGRHSMETHSIGAALIAGVAAFVLARTLDVRTSTGGSYGPSRFVRTLGVRTNLGAALLVAAVWFVHPLMDALGEDSSAPFGVMLLWPFSQEFFIAPLPIFDAISRMWWRDDVWTHNFVAAAKEVAVLGPAVLVAGFLRSFLKKSGFGRHYPR